MSGVEKMMNTNETPNNKTINNNYMKQRFSKLWNNLGGYDAEKEYALLHKQYTQKHRHYHNLNHIQNVLSEFDSIKHQSTNHLSIELAIWYHDIVYDPHATDNEHSSAFWLIKSGHKAGIRDYYLNAAWRLILATMHVGEPTTIDEKIIMDCDISSFGKSKEEFDKSNSNIRKEYAFVDPELYTKKRNEILLKFLNKERIYYIEDMHNKYEHNARKNIESALY